MVPHDLPDSSAATCAAPRSSSAGTLQAAGSGAAILGVCCRSRATRSANTNPSRSELDANRLAPCTRSGPPPHRVQPRQARPAGQIGDHSTHHVVSGRCDRMGSWAGPMPRALQSWEIPGKREKTTRPSWSHRETPAREPAAHGKFPGHHVARRQFGQPVTLGHEPLPFGIQQNRPPRTASEMSASGFSGVSSAVGWNWTNSMSASRAPARWAIANPSPVATCGLVV